MFSVTTIICTYIFWATPGAVWEVILALHSAITPGKYETIWDKTTWNNMGCKS